VTRTTCRPECAGIQTITKEFIDFDSRVPDAGDIDLAEFQRAVSGGASRRAPLSNYGPSRVTAAPSISKPARGF
jgi:hypothetical protein